MWLSDGVTAEEWPCADASITAVGAFKGEWDRDALAEYEDGTLAAVSNGAETFLYK